MKSTIMTEMESKALALAISDLKKKALSAKQEGNVDEAVKLLKQAKSLEAVEPEKYDEIDSPLYWKRLAVLFKQSGEIDHAKKSLLRAKQLEAEASNSMDSNAENESAIESNDIRTTAKPEPHREATSENGDNVSQSEGFGSNEEIDEDLLDELGEDTEEIDLDSLVVKFSDVEMMDEEMMVEFRLGGMPVPSQDEYSAKVLEYKKKALEFKKAKNIPKATENLRTAKKLEKVQLALKHMDEGLGLRIHDDPQGWIETLNPEESSLLGELLQSNEGPDGHVVIHDAEHDKLSVEELESMDDEEIIEFVEMMGESSLPSVSQLQEEASQQKKKALEYKQAGNIDMAKVTLLDSKKTNAQGDRLVSILARIRDGSATKNDVSVQDLESIVDRETKQATSQPVKQMAPNDPWLSKTSAEIKAEVIRLKNEKKVKEATAMMKKLKLVLQKEKDQAEADKCAHLIAEVQKRLDDCESQIALWQYFEWFVDRTTGNEQYLRWSQFASQCRQVIQVLKKNGSSSVTITTLPKVAAKLYLLPEDPVEIVERGMSDKASSPSNKLDGALEVAVLNLLDMYKNEKLQKVMQKHKDLELPQLRVDAKVHLPLQQGDSSQGMHLSFAPTSAEKKGSSLVYRFDPSVSTSRHQVGMPRGDSKQAKTILRRMETKTIQFGVYFVHPRQGKTETKAKSSWFFGSSKPYPKPVDTESDENKDISIGKVAIELRQLLTRNSIAGDFPLVVNSKALGGAVRICLRTSPPIDRERYEGSTDNKLPTLRTYEDGLLFQFNAVLNSQENEGQA